MVEGIMQNYVVKAVSGSGLGRYSKEGKIL